MTSRESDSSGEYHADVAASNKRSLGLTKNGWDGRGYAPKAAAAADPKRFRRGDDYHDDGNDKDDYRYQQRYQKKDTGNSHYRQGGDDYAEQEYDVGGDWNQSEQPSRDLKYTQEFPDEDRYGNQEDEVELDEFGRQRAPPNMIRKAAPDEWPPCFETHGSSYVFDNRCAMFYQSDSGFFYDPKTKLYYGNKQGAYFRYDESKKPPFEQVQNAIPRLEESSNQLDPILSSKSTDRNKKDAGKKMISINLKSKTLARPKPKKKERIVADVKPAPIPPASSSSQVQKRHGADMYKWSERQVEKKDEVKQQDTPKDKVVKVVKTIKGEPICLLCKRKFPTIEKLHYHEKASALHQENVAKQASVIKTETSDPSRTDYVDRAQQRRDMHGTESSMTAPSLKVPAASLHTNPAGPPPTNHPSENLGQSNIGNQMLKKLGWKSGESLGRQDANQNEVQIAIVKDWEKIEAIASNGGKGRHPPGGSRHHR